MEVFTIPDDLLSYTENYDKKNYMIWSDECYEMQSFRSRSKEHYLKEQKNRCCYCKSYISSENGLHWQVEHVLPKSLYPQFLFEPKNLAVICPDCNNAKSNKNPHVNGDKALSQISYPRVSGRFKIIHPLYDDYFEHMIRQSADHPDYPDHYFLIPVKGSSKGRVTFKMCDLDRFLIDFAGLVDMSGRHVRQFNTIMDMDFSSLSTEEGNKIIVKILESR